jgi:hypothetical protein
MALVPTLALVACSGAGNSMTAPSGTAGTLAVQPPPNGSTTIGFSNFNQSTLEVTVDTLTSSTQATSVIDAGKIQIQIWVNASGVPTTFVNGAVGQWVNLSGSGTAPAGGATHTVVDLDNLTSLGLSAITANADCGDVVSFRAHYVTGGGATKVDTHQSSPADFTISCGGCSTTYGQGYWKTPSHWPAGVSSVQLGTVTYTQAEAIGILTSSSANSNGYIQLAIQLIAAKLNVANGAANTAAATIAAADAIIGSNVIPPVGSASVPAGTYDTLKDALEAYNNSCSDE